MPGMSPSPEPERNDAAALAELAAVFGDRLSTAEAVRRNHAAVEGFHPDLPPDAVLMVRTTEEVAEALRICARHRYPVIPYGAGSSVEGHVLAPEGGLSLDLSEMNAILEVSPGDLDCRVQSGVTRKQLNAHLRDLGLFFPVDPGADATLGGMVATNASGTTTIRYGGMRANVLGLTVALADGRVIRTGGRARKSSAGYDLTNLFTGSEGTLGVVTEIQLRLHGVPEETIAAVCPFETLEGAVNTVIEAVQYGVPMARMELLDALAMKAFNQYGGGAYDERPTLFLEFQGQAVAVQEQVQLVGELCAANGGGAFRWASAQEERDALWDARHKAYFAALSLSPGKRAVITDVCVPVSRLAETILQTRADIDATGVVGPILGHVADGNFHCILLVDPSDADEVARARALSDRMVRRGLAAGGTCTGEHGVGLGKRAFLQAQHGEAVSVMADLKRALDPLGILNPGKIFA